MKTELRSKAHSMVPSQTVVEVWHGGKFLATITGMARREDRSLARRAPHSHSAFHLF